MQRIAKIDPSYQKQGIEWLVLEEDIENTGGVFLYLHESLEKKCSYDLWYENIEQAINVASSTWKVSKDDWVTLESDAGMVNS